MNRMLCNQATLACRDGKGVSRLLAMLSSATPLIVSVYIYKTYLEEYPEGEASQIARRHGSNIVGAGARVRRDGGGDDSEHETGCRSPRQPATLVAPVGAEEPHS